MNSKYEEWYDEQIEKNFNVEQIPRISPEQIHALEQDNEKLVHIRANREERTKRLGITEEDPIQLEFDFGVND